MKINSKITVPHCFGVSCVHHLPSEEEPQTKTKNSSETIKLIKSNGDVKIYDRPIRALELMQQFPKHMVCRSDSFYIGQKTPFLSRNEKLKLGNYYFLLHSVFFQSALSFAALSRSRTAFSGNKSPFEVVRTRSGGLRVKVCEEMIVKHHREFVLEEDHHRNCRGVLLNTPQLRKEYEALVGRRRRWKPKLDTIKEKKKKKKSAEGNKRLKIKRLLV